MPSRATGWFSAGLRWSQDTCQNLMMSLFQQACGTTIFLQRLTRSARSRSSQPGLNVRQGTVNFALCLHVLPAPHEGAWPGCETMVESEGHARSWVGPVRADQCRRRTRVHVGRCHSTERDGPGRYTQHVLPHKLVFGSPRHV
jgi:hypothetical protein